MAADVVAAISGQPPNRKPGCWLSCWPGSARGRISCAGRIDRLSPEEEIGLFGELVISTSSLAAGAVLTCWCRHGWVLAAGFRTSRADTVGIEIKSTTSANGFPAQISSLEQLDGLAGRAILLAAMRLCEQQSGETLSEVSLICEAGRAHAQHLVVP